METLQLTKHHGLGNDFLIALLSDEAKSQLDALRLDWPGLAREACNRRTGVGADGLLLGIEPVWSNPTWHENTDSGSSYPDGNATVRMVLYNSDGSRAAMSGNGSACLANAVASAQEPWSSHIHDLRDASLDLKIATDSGTRNVRWHSPYVESVDGEPIPIDTHIDITLPPVMAGPEICPALDELISGSFGDAARSTGDVGNPHLVIAAESRVTADETARLGALYEGHFHGGINVEFVWPNDGPSKAAGQPQSSLGMSVWERGAGLTDACGTGAVVAVTRAREWGLITSDIFTSVSMPGGLATIAQVAADKPPVLQVWADHVADIGWPLRGPWLDA
ncbi:diaminopimelate epimerase [Candidatus Poriferisodalis sp.]|uniref:diaminopimelate epimerase n=1 Tax=Candidatus Poriferisodalis sp. TaxID=3101277 RepID=UPI003B51F2E6